MDLPVFSHLFSYGSVTLMVSESVTCEIRLSTTSDKRLTGRFLIDYWHYLIVMGDTFCGIDPVSGTPELFLSAARV